MKRYYLIDFENVFSKGLTGCSQLGKKDHIILFYTNYTKYIEIDIIREHGKANLKFYKVHDGKQSLDMHIASYIGYIIGKNRSDDIEIVIISKDKDYDHIIEFWIEKKGIKISRAVQVGMSKTFSDKKEVEPATPQKPAEKPVDETVELKKKIQEPLQKEGIAVDRINGVTSVVVKNYAEKDSKQKIYRGIISKYGQEVGLDLYRLIKEHL